jgi:hypothetical protein
VAILCFRGTEPTSVLNWLTDGSISPAPFLAGHVHGGIFRNLQAIWPLVEVALRLVFLAIPLREDSAQNEHYEAIYQSLTGLPGAAATDYQDAHLKQFESLYICGHSLGGAMAALAAANLWTEAKYAAFAPKFRGCYTYGQPMVATPDLADRLNGDVGHKIFRHIFANDLVPRLPPLSTGRFKHFGQEYRSEGGGEGWTYSPVPAKQSDSVLSLGIGAFAFVAQQFPVLRSFLSLPYSLDHHSPRHYLNASEASLDSKL